MSVHRSAFVPPPKVMSAVVHIVPTSMPAGRRSEGARTAHRSGVRPAPQDAALEPEGRARRARAPSRSSASTTQRRAETLSVADCVAIAREAAELVALGRSPAALAAATVGPRLIAAVSSPSCGQPLGAELLELDEILLGARAPAPISTIASPWTASASRSFGSSASALLVKRIALPNSFSRWATRASVTKAARLRGSTASAVSSSIVGPTNLPAARCVSPCCSSSTERGTIWSSGRWPRDRAPTSASRQLRQSATGGQQAHHISSSSRRPSMAGPAARRKSHRCRHARGEQPPGPSERPAAIGVSCTIQDERRLRKSSTLACPFAGQDRADRIDEPAARPDQLGGDVEQSRLQLPRRDRGARASAASALPGFAARCRCPSRARRPARRRPAPASRPALRLVGGLSSRVSIRAPARSARGAASTGASDWCRWRGSLRPARRRPAPAPCRLRRRTDRACAHARRRLAGERDQLAALVLHFDQACRRRPDDRRPCCRAAAAGPTG